MEKENVVVKEKQRELTVAVIDKLIAIVKESRVEEKQFKLLMKLYCTLTDDDSCSISMPPGIIGFGEFLKRKLEGMKDDKEEEKPNDDS
jgi:hypothetical protein